MDSSAAERRHQPQSRNRSSVVGERRTSSYLGVPRRGVRVRSLPSSGVIALVLFLLVVCLSCSTTALPRRNPHQQRSAHHIRSRTLTETSPPSSPPASLESQASSGASSTAPASAPAPGPAEEEEGEPVPVEWYQAHGWLMWIAYGVLMPTAILVARYFQPVSPIWFHVHAYMQFACLACVTAAIAISLVGFQALSDSLHAQLGLAIFILTALQPLLALLRPKKGSSLRVLWFSSHLLFGMAALALGWWNCVTGLQLYGEDWGTDTQVLQILFLASIAAFTFIYLFLGRWDHLVGQADSDQTSPPDGLHRKPTAACCPGCVPSRRKLPDYL